MPKDVKTMDNDEKVQLFGKDVDVSVTFVGLSNAGKTTLVRRLKGEAPISTEYLPTMGLNIEMIETPDGLDVMAVDLGGQSQFMAGLWEPFVRKSRGIVFVFDSADKSKVEEAGVWLKRVIGWTSEESAFLFLANKQDLEQAMSLEEIIEALDLKDVMMERPRTFAVHPVSALLNQGVKEAWEWLLDRIKASQVSLSEKSSS